MSLLALCNPLLDISASVGPEYLEKYGLKPFDAILAEEKHQPIFVDLIENHKPDYSAGGSAQNSARVAQWLLQTPKATTYLGAVGNDANAKRLSEASAKDGVNTQYYVDEAHPTGTCAVLVCNKDRSLVTNLGAANHFNPSHLAKPEIAALIEEAKFFYVSGFFLTVSPPSALQLAKHASEKNKSFMLSLSAPFICQFFSDPVNELLPYTDYIVGNEHEAVAFGTKWGFGDKIEDLPEIAKKICALPKINAKQSRTVIFTQGPGETLIVKDGEVQRFPVIPCPQEKIVDLNGAGDAWLGGFLAYRVRDAAIDQCVRAANYCANVVIQRQGCTYPEKPEFKEEVKKEKKDKKEKDEKKEKKEKKDDKDKDEKKEKKDDKDKDEKKEKKEKKEGKDKDEKKEGKDKDEKKEKKEKK